MGTYLEHSKDLEGIKCFFTVSYMCFPNRLGISRETDNYPEYLLP